MPDFFENFSDAGTRSPLSVTEFTQRIKTLVEGAFPAVSIRGDVSNLRIQTSGHAYFTLKDDQSQISAVVFRGTLARTSVRLRDGMQLVADGEIDVYERRGNYQLVVRAFREEGVGRLQEAFERLRQKLADEGLFDKKLKREIPSLPQTVAFVTSPTGAAIRDFISILRRRSWTGRVLVVPAKVQGDGAAGDIVHGIEMANALATKPDLLVVGRGGGSLEDLWCFNEESVARAVRASSIPVISAVGHEIDFTLSDFAADLRAETPSAAAEYISSARLDLVSRFDSAAASLDDATERALHDFSQRVDLLELNLARHSPESQLRLIKERIAGASARLDAGARSELARFRDALSTRAFALERKNPEHAVRFARLRLDQLKTRLAASGIDSVLRRGFAVARDSETGKIIDRARDIGFGKLVELQFSDGKTRVEGRDLN